jgi:peptidoglycan/LPS O-acetylase OafA/YrhL
MTSVVIMVVVLAACGLFVRVWLPRQSLEGRLIFSLGLLSFALYLFAYAMYSACHGEVDFLRNPMACARDGAVAFNPRADEVPRGR